jgi:hypothetical protein
MWVNSDLWFSFYGAESHLKTRRIFFISLWRRNKLMSLWHWSKLRSLWHWSKLRSLWHWSKLRSLWRELRRVLTKMTCFGETKMMSLAKQLWGGNGQRLRRDNLYFVMYFCNFGLKQPQLWRELAINYDENWHQLWCDEIILTTRISKRRKNWKGLTICCLQCRRSANFSWPRSIHKGTGFLSQRCHHEG